MSGRVFNNNKTIDFAKKERIERLLSKIESFSKSIKEDKETIKQIKEDVKNINDEVIQIGSDGKSAIKILRQKISDFVSRLQNTNVDSDFEDRFQKLDEYDAEELKNEIEPVLDNYIENKMIPSDFHYDDIIDYSKNMNSEKIQIVHTKLVDAFNNEELLNKSYGYSEWDNSFNSLTKGLVKIPINSNLKTINFGLTYRQRFSISTDDNEHILERYYTGKIFFNKCNKNNDDFEVRAIIYNADNNSLNETDGLGPVIKLYIEKNNDHICIRPKSIVPYKMLPLLKKNKSKSIQESEIDLIDINAYNTKIGSFNKIGYLKDDEEYVDRNGNKIELGDKIGISYEINFTIHDNSIFDNDKKLSIETYTSSTSLQPYPVSKELEIKSSPVGFITLIGFDYSETSTKKDEYNIGTNIERKIFKNFNLIKNSELDKPIHNRTPIG